MRGHGGAIIIAGGGSNEIPRGRALAANACLSAAHGRVIRARIRCTIGYGRKLDHRFLSAKERRRRRTPFDCSLTVRASGRFEAMVKRIARRFEYGGMVRKLDI